MNEHVTNSDTLVSKGLFILFQLFICFCLMSIVLIFVYTFSNGRTPTWWYHTLTKSSCNTSKSIAHINFVNNELFIPSKAIGECSAWDKSTSYDYNPAIVEILLSLDDFKPLNAKNAAKDKIKDGEVRIYLEGKRRDIADIDPNLAITDNTLEFSHFETEYPYKKTHSLVTAMNNGVIHYEPVRKTFSTDTYVHYDENKQPDFIVECGVKYSICECTSNYENLFDNVTFRYCFNQTHIDQVLEIDQKVNAFLQKSKKLF